MATVKNCHPVKDANNGFVELDPLSGRTMVILRNPINVIPSYFNRHYGELLVLIIAWIIYQQYY